MRRSEMAVCLGIVLAAAGAWISTAPASAAGDGFSAGYVPLRHVRITSDDPRALRGQLEAEGFDVGCTPVHHDALEAVVTVAELEGLVKRGLDVEVLQVGRPFREILKERAAIESAPAGDGDGGLVPNGYLDINEINAAMTATAAAYPAICQVVDLTAAFGVPMTVENRRIFAVKISDNVAADENEPATLLVSNHHAREIVTPVIALHAMEQLTTLYGSDPAITQVVDDNEIWIAPVWNPDGYNWVFIGDNLWRKNRRVFPQGEGVDLNRNYPFGWDSACGGSTNVTSNTYRGPSPSSEAETQTMTAFADARHFAKVFDFHSFSEEVRYGTGCLNNPLTSFWQSEATAIANLVPGYNPASSCCTGGDIHFHFATKGAHAFLWETHSEFQPTHQSALDEAALIFPAIVSFLERPISVSGTVTDAVTGLPVVATITNLDLAFANGETNVSGGPFARYHTVLPAGQYDLEFSAPGYETVVHTVNVTANGAEVLHVQLAPPLVSFNWPNGIPSLLDPGGAAVRVRVAELQPGALVPGTETLHLDTGGGFQTMPLVLVTGDLYDAVFPATTCGTAMSFYVSARDTSGRTVTDPPGAPATTHDATSATSIAVAFADDFEVAQGWTEEILGATNGQWDRGVPVNDPGWAHDPESDGDGSGQCYLTENAPGNTDVDNGAVRITSPLLDLAAGGATVRYLYYLRLTNSDGSDRILVEMSGNGDAGPWIEIARHDTDGGLTWRDHTITQDDLYAAGVTMTATMKIRFEVNDANPQSIVESAIDGIDIETVVCGGGGCPADVNGDNTVNVFDLLEVLAAWGPCPGCPADITGDGVVNVFDLLEVLGAWGPC